MIEIEACLTIQIIAGDMLGKLLACGSSVQHVGASK